MRDELAETDAHLLATMTKRVPGMFAKAYRWGAEMQEIAEFAREDPAAHDIWMAISKLYERLAQDAAGDKDEIETLAGFFAPR